MSDYTSGAGDWRVELCRNVVTRSFAEKFPDLAAQTFWVVRDPDGWSFGGFRTRDRAVAVLPRCRADEDGLDAWLHILPPGETVAVDAGNEVPSVADE